MGGPGSGSHYHWWRGKRKTTVEECLTLDANRWMREGILKPGIRQSGSWWWIYTTDQKCTITYEVSTLTMDRPRVRLSYAWSRAATGERGDEDYHVRLTITRPRFGGLRWWFACPLVKGGRPCERRASKLYLPPGARFFGCRQCHNLTYTSCQESHKYDGMYHFLAAAMGHDFATVKRIMQSLARRR